MKRYWIVDAYARSLECLLLEAGIYRTEATGRNDDIVAIPSLPELIIPLKQIWGS